MKKSQGIAFNEWFDSLQIQVLDLSGFQFRDRKAARQDYDDDLDMFDVASDIASEHKDDDR